MNKHDGKIISCVEREYLARSILLLVRYNNSNGKVMTIKFLKKWSARFSRSHIEMRVFDMYVALNPEYTYQKYDEDLCTRLATSIYIMANYDNGLETYSREKSYYEGIIVNLMHKFFYRKTFYQIQDVLSEIY